MGVVIVKRVQATLCISATSFSDANATVSGPAASEGGPASQPGEVHEAVIDVAVTGLTVGLAVLLAIVCVSRHRSLKEKIAHELTENEKTGCRESEEGLKA